MSDSVLGPKQQKWLEALESGEYEQGRSYLKSSDQDGKCKFCCLGVWCEISGVETSSTETISSIVVEGETLPKLEAHKFRNGDDTDAYVLPNGIPETLGLRDHVGRFSQAIYIGGYPYNDVTELNDSTKLFSFADIAKVIRENPHQVFKEFV